MMLPGAVYQPADITLMRSMLDHPARANIPLDTPLVLEDDRAAKAATIAFPPKKKPSISVRTSADAPASAVAK